MLGGRKIIRISSQVIPARHDKCRILIRSSIDRISVFSCLFYLLVQAGHHLNFISWYLNVGNLLTSCVVNVTERVDPVPPTVLGLTWWADFLPVNVTQTTREVRTNLGVGTVGSPSPPHHRRNDKNPNCSKSIPCLPPPENCCFQCCKISFETQF